MLKRKSLIGLIFISGIILFFIFRDPSDEKVVHSLESLFPRLEGTGLTAYRNQDWCQVLAYNEKAFSNTNRSTCVYVTNIATLPFSAEASLKLKEISNILSDAKIPVRSVENIKISDGKFTFIEFHEDCSCRTRYVFDPGYGSPPSDVRNELWHFPIDSNWYRVEEDWN